MEPNQSNTRIFESRALHRLLEKLELELREMRNTNMETTSRIDKHGALHNVCSQILESGETFIRQYRVRDEMLTMLANCLYEREDMALQDMSATVIACLVGVRKELAPKLADLDVIGTLKNLLLSPSPKLRFSGVWALGNIATTSETLCSAVIEEGFIDYLVPLLSPNASMGMLLKATPMLWKMYRLFPQPITVTEQLLPALSSLLEHPDTTIVLNVLGTIRHMSAQDAVHKRMVIESAVPASLADLLDNRNVVVVENVLFQLAHLADGPIAHIQKVVDLGVLQKIIAYLLHIKPQVRVQSLRLLANIATGNRAHTEAIIKEDLVQSIVENLYTTHDGIVLEAAKVIWNFTVYSSYPQLTVFLFNGVVAPFLVALGSNDDELLRIVLCCLGNMMNKGGALADYVVRRIIARKALRKIEKLIESHNPRIRMLAYDIIDVKFQHCYTESEFKNLRNCRKIRTKKTQH